MKRRKVLSIVSSVLISAQCLSPLAINAAESQSVILQSTSVYETRFKELYNDIKNSSNGYFSPEGIPYHSIETLMVEAPDHGHESTSESASFYVWLEAMNGKFTGDYTGLAKAWDVIEKYYIPTDLDQPGQNGYNPNSPATYAAEYPLPNGYPSPLQFGAAVGKDPITNELRNTYGTNKVYGMHWLIDGDNFYGYGQRGDGTSSPSYINTFQRGEQESTWETIPQPSWEAFKWGGPNGFLPLFTGDATYSKQWRYTNAPDADARLVQAMYWADKWAQESGQSVDTYVAKASKMGDYLRYSFFDKYFMKIGAQGLTPGNGYDAAHYLMSWYYAWGGAMPGSGDWAWKIGSSHNHFGYQNPMAAWALSTDEKLKPTSASGASDWGKSLDRQIEFYQWLQSAEGAISGGATNSYGGSYQTYPAGTSTFYGMAYEENPVYKDPGSNTWFGMQAWSMQRMAEYYYESGDTRVKPLLDKWAAWAKSEVKLHSDGTFEIPSTIDWTGQPDTWTGSSTGNNNLHVEVVNYGTDLGISASLANTLIYYAAATEKYAAGQEYESYVGIAEELLNRMWTLYRDDKGVAVLERRADFDRFFEQEVYVPENFTGKMANGDEIKPGVKFIDIRTKYKDDPDFARLEEAYKNGEDFEITYHRFWAQCEIAIANGTMAMLYPNGVQVLPEVSITLPTNNTVIEWDKDSVSIPVTAEASITDGAITKVEFFADGVKFGETPGQVTGPGYTLDYIPTQENLDENDNKTVELTAVATSDKGTSKTSSPVTIKVHFNDIAKLSIVITQPTEGAVIEWDKSSVSIPVTAEASITDGAVTKVEFFADGVKFGETPGQVSGAGYIIAYVPTKENLDEDGNKTVVLTAAATSDKGTSKTSSPVTIKVHFNDIAKLSIVITEPTAGAVVDATQGQVQVPVAAEATVENGEIDKIVLYANGETIGEANSGSIEAIYLTADGFGPTPDGIVDVTFTAEVFTTENLSQISAPVTIQVKLPVEVVPPVAVQIGVDTVSQGGISTNTLGKQYTITNQGQEPIDLSKVSIRYYYTVDGDMAQSFWCDSAGLQLNKAPWYLDFTTKVKGQIVKMDMPTANADYYIEIYFDSNEILEGGGKLTAATRVAKSNWSNYDQSNDYSYPSSVVVLYNNEVVKGELPR